MKHQHHHNGYEHGCEDNFWSVYLWLTTFLLGFLVGSRLPEWMVIFESIGFFNGLVFIITGKHEF